MKTLKVAIFTMLVIMALSVSAFAQANKAGSSTAGMTFYVNDPGGRNIVTFNSSAPLEDIVGVSHQITGYLTFDPANPDKGGKAEFAVPVSSLDTGIPARNGHMQSEGWLDAAKYPDIILTVDKIVSMKKVKETQSAVTYDVSANAGISIHGITKAVVIPARITYMTESEATQKRLPGNLLAVRATFDITLADFGITGPKEAAIVGSKVGENISIEVSVMGSTKSEAPAKM